MALDVEFLDMLTETVAIKPWSSQDEYTEPTYGTSVNYKARVSGKRTLVRNAEGQEVVSTHAVYLGQYLAASTKDEITLPDGTKPPVLSVKQSPDDAGGYATVLYLE